jgi:hypothetical protein
MPTGTQPYAPPTQGQNLSQYLASLGNIGDNSFLGNINATNAAGQEFNADALTPGYVPYVAGSGDFSSNANSITGGPTGTEVPGPTNTTLPSDVTAPSPDSWWEKLIEYGIPLAAGAGFADAALAPAVAGVGSGITDVDIEAANELGPLGGPANPITPALPGTLEFASPLGSPGYPGDFSAFTGAPPTDVPNPLPDQTIAPAGDATPASPLTTPNTNTQGLLDTASAFSNAYSGASPATVNAFTNPVATGPTFDSTGLVNNSLLPGDVGAPTAGAGGGGNGFDLSSILSAAKSMGVSPLSALSLLGSILAKPKTPNIPQLTDLAQTAQANATALGGTEATDLAAGQTGKLPAGAQTQINQAEQSAEAAIKSKYAAMGLSGSTMEQQDLIAAQNQAIAAQFNEAQTLANQGVQIAGVINSGDATAAQIYETIMQTVLQQDSQLQAALANFASSSALGAAIANRNSGTG